MGRGAKSDRVQRDRGDNRYDRSQSPSGDQRRSGTRQKEDDRRRRSDSSRHSSSRKRTRHDSNEVRPECLRDGGRSPETSASEPEPEAERDSESSERGRKSLRRSRWGAEQSSRSEKVAAREQRRRNGGPGQEEADEPEEEEAEPLPVTLFKDELMKAVRASQVLVCTGETGSGKTTQIPQYLLELVRERDTDSRGEDCDSGERTARGGGGGGGQKSGRRLMVAVTQPRRVAATSVARRVADERRCRLGEEVGYSIRFEDRTGSRTRIKYMTDGVLVRECLEDPLLSRYGVVMLDEAHERSIDTDILFGLLKRALARRPDLHAVITSATLDVERFAEFFDGCPFLRVPGRTHAVDVYHSKTRQVKGGDIA